MNVCWDDNCLRIIFRQRSWDQSSLFDGSFTWISLSLCLTVSDRIKMKNINHETCQTFSVVQSWSSCSVSSPSPQSRPQHKHLIWVWTTPGDAESSYQNLESRTASLCSSTLSSRTMFSHPALLHSETDTRREHLLRNGFKKKAICHSR